MDHFFHNFPRLEAIDVASLQSDLISIPIRMGSRQAGNIRAIRRGSQLKLSLGDGSDKVEKSQTVTIKQFQVQGNQHLCLLCPSCKKWRKRLFLAERHQTLFYRAASPFSFICKECVDLSADHFATGH